MTPSLFARLLLLFGLLWSAASGAVSSTTSSTVYTGAGTTAVYPYTWQIAAPADLLCYEINAAGTAATKLTLTTDYTVSGVGIATGGNVTLTAGNLASGVRLFIASDPAQLQTLLLQQGTAINPAALGAALDLLTREVQGTRRVANASIQIPLAESLDGYALTLPTKSQRASMLVGFDANGNVISSGGTGGIAISAAMTPVVQASTLALGRSAMGPWSDALATATGGTTARDMQTRFADVANVKDFGAKGDGATDDTVAFQAAMNTGKTVYIPGTSSFYLINGTISYFAAGQTAYGDGYLSFVKQTHATANLFYASTLNGVRLSHVRLMPSQGRTSMRDGCAAQFYNCGRCVMDNNIVTYNPLGNKSGLSMDTCTDFLVTNNEFYDASSIAGQVESNAGTDIDCIYSAQRGLVAFNRCVSGNSHGIKFQTIGNGTDTCAYNRVQGNIVAGCQGHGILFYDLFPASTMKKNAIVGNTVKDIKGTVHDAGNVYLYGIGIYNAGGAETLIEANTIENVCQSTVSESLPCGAIGSDMDDTTIVGNTIDTSGKHGIRVDFSGNRGVDGHNAALIANNSVKNTTKDGISVNQVWRTKIVGNKVYNSAHGLITRRGNNASLDVECIVADNTLDTSTSAADAMQIGEVATAVITHNVVLNSAEHGIVTTYCTDLIASENVVKTFTNNGFQIDANTTRGQLRGNTIVGGTNGIQNNGSAIVYADNLFSGQSGAPTVGNSWATFTTNNGSGTPDVSGHSYFKTSATTAISDFLGKSDGKEITVVFLHAVLVNQNPGMVLAGNVNASATVGSSMTFKYDLANARWVETGRSIH